MDGTSGYTVATIGCLICAAMPCDEYCWSLEHPDDKGGFKNEKQIKGTKKWKERK